MSLGPIPEKIRLKMYDLCGGLCEYCGSNKLENNPHHIPYRSQPGSHNDTNHLIWLCIRCHKWAHRIRNAMEDNSYQTFRQWYDQLPVHYLMRWRKNKI